METQPDGRSLARSSSRPRSNNSRPSSRSPPSSSPSRPQQRQRASTSNQSPSDGPRGTTSSVPSSWSASSDRQLGHAVSPDPSDRVFPIRSVISFEPAGTSSGDHDTSPRVPDHGQYPAPRPSSVRCESATTEMADSRRPGFVTTSAAAGALSSPTEYTIPPTRRQNTLSGPMSSVQADAARHSSSVPLPIFQEVTSDAEEESNPPDEAHEAQENLSKGRQSSGASIHEGMFTARFRHVMTEDGHAVITGRDGVLQRCEDEPIHAPGAVQGFGLLLAIREEAEGRFSVRYVSENSERLIGYSPRQLFRMVNFLDILAEEQQDNLLDHIDFIRDEDADPATNGPEVFGLSIRPPGRKTVKLWCAIHINPAHPDLILCEFELDDDQQYPLRPAGEVTPDVPEDTLRSNPTLEELTESTEILSKPLRVLRSARKRRGEAGAMQVFDIMSQVQEQLASAPTLDVFLKILVGIVKELTGFHRVMIYQFDSSFNGKVVTELVDTTHTRDLFKGLHFPATDIPKQARELYKLNKVRLLYDRDLDTARLVCKSTEDLETALDMSHSYLRAMSPIHLKYLANMAVRSSMSISINAFNDLWGLIACHSYGPQGMRVSFPIRKMCRLVGDTASRNIERLSYASRLQARKLINTAPTDKNPSGYIIASSEDLLRLFDADFGMLSIQGETKILGVLEQSQEALAMLEYLRIRQITSVVTSQDIRDDFPDLRYPPGFAVIAGLLYVPLSVGGSDFIVFFRKGQVKEVKWAGNPYEKILREGTMAYLEPRKSFQTWHETVLGKCREWSEEQVETAAVLCLVYGKFIEVWRQKEAALQSSRLTRLLLANSAHEVRTPLNAIINYLEIALEGSLDQETRDNLAKSHSASKSLIYVINDLLDLTKTEEGQNLVKDEIFDLPACLREATDPFINEAKRKGLVYDVYQHPGCPQFVYGDSRRVRQAISNVTANAVQHTSDGSVRVELYVVEVSERRVRVEVVVEDTGRGMSAKQLDVLFRDLEQVDTDMGGVEASREPENAEQKPDDRILGLGLAVVARIVRNMDGQLRLKSDEGKGSRFVVQMRFELPDESPGSIEGAGQPAPSTTGSSIASVAKTIQPPEGEILLVDRGSSVPATATHGAGISASASATALSQGHAAETASIGSHRSVASRGSRTSNRSSRSDAERLIDAIQTPLSLGEYNPGSPKRHRDSKDSRSGTVQPVDSGSSVTQTHPPSTSTTTTTASSDVTETGWARSASPSALEKTEERQPQTGFATVRDTKTPIRPVKVPDEYTDQPSHPQQGDSSRVLFEIADPVSSEAPASESGTTTSASNQEATALRVLIAEDDPINMKILRKRLEKAGHGVFHAVNGEECAAMYRRTPSAFDVVLMDMQMPIMDGLTSTKTIRALEHSSEHAGHSHLAAHNGRIPIFAVSASLVERDKNVYVDAGFDGWILKPIDFKRLHTLLQGIIDDETRTSCLYSEGSWECGGWFCPTHAVAVEDEYNPDTEGEQTPLAAPDQ